MSFELLKGFRVIDMSQYAPGPYCSLLLSDLGAEVFKIEPPGGEPMRRVGPLDENGISNWYKVLNRGKKIIELDTFDQTAWMQSEKNMKKRKKLINEMKRGNDLKVVARSQRGTTTTDYYTLLGFTNAYNKIKNMCK